MIEFLVGLAEVVGVLALIALVLYKVAARINPKGFEADKNTFYQETGISLCCKTHVLHCYHTVGLSWEHDSKKAMQCCRCGSVKHATWLFKRPKEVFHHIND